MLLLIETFAEMEEGDGDKNQGLLNMEGCQPAQTRSLSQE